MSTYRVRLYVITDDSGEGVVPVGKEIAFYYLNLPFVPAAGMTFELRTFRDSAWWSQPRVESVFYCPAENLFECECRICGRSDSMTDGEFADLLDREGWMFVP